MALRNLLLLTGLFAAIPIIRSRSGLLLAKGAWPVYVLFAFFLWLIVHFTFFAGILTEQTHELLGEWPRNLLAGVLGLGLGLSLNDGRLYVQRSRGLETVLIMGFAGTALIFCGRYAYEIYRTGHWLHHNFFMTPYLGKTPLVIFGSIFLPLMFIKILDALKGQESWRWYLYGALGTTFTLCMFYFGNTKNGFAIFALLFGYLLFCTVRQLVGTTLQPKRSGIGIAVVLLSALAFGYAGKKHIESNSA